MIQFSDIPKPFRVPLGLFVVAIGVIPPAGFYYTSNSPRPELLSILAIVGPCAVLCLLAFVASRLIFRKPEAQTVAGAVGSVLLLIVALFVAAAWHDSVGELIAWLPIVLLFGAMAMSPLVALTWLGTRIMFEGAIRRPHGPPESEE